VPQNSEIRSLQNTPISAVDSRPPTRVVRGPDQPKRCVPPPRGVRHLPSAHTAPTCRCERTSNPTRTQDLTPPNQATATSSGTGVLSALRWREEFTIRQAMADKTAWPVVGHARCALSIGPVIPKAGSSMPTIITAENHNRPRAAAQFLSHRTKTHRVVRSYRGGK